MSSTENRRRFKRGIDSVRARRQRASQLHSLRKRHRQQELQKKRIASPDRGGAADPASNSPPAATRSSVKAVLIPQYATALCSQVSSQADLVRVLESLRFFRKLLSQHVSHIDDVVRAGVLPGMLKCLVQTKHQEVSREAAWGLVNILSGTAEHTAAVQQADGFKAITRCLEHPDVVIREMCCQCLHNIAADGEAYRKMLLEAGALQQLLRILENHVQDVSQPVASLVTQCAEALAALCFEAGIEPAQLACPAFVAVLKHRTERGVRLTALRALRWTAQRTSKHSRAVVRAGALPLLISLLKGSCEPIITEAVASITRITSWDESYTDQVLRMDGYKLISGMLRNPCFRKCHKLEEEALCACCNLVACGEEHIGALIRLKVVGELCGRWQTLPAGSQRQAAYLLSDIMIDGNKGHKRYMANTKFLHCLGGMLESPDMELIENLLEGLHRLCHADRKNADVVEESGVLDKVEWLTSQEQVHQKLYDKAASLIETYFGGAHSGEDENVENQSEAWQQGHKEALNLFSNIDFGPRNPAGTKAPNLFASNGFGQPAALGHQRERCG